METPKKIKFSEQQIILLCAGFVAAILFIGGWYLGNQRATTEYEGTISNYASENVQLYSELLEWKEMAGATGPVSADAAMEALYAAYPADGTLASIEYPFSDCTRFSYYHKIEDWPIPFTEKAFTLTWNGVITAGIEMKDVSIEANKAGDKLIVTIPNTKILSFVIDEKSFELLDEQNNLLNPISLEDLLELEVDLKERMMDRATKNTILTTAQRNAEMLITDALRSSPTIGSFYKIEFKTK